MPEDKRIYIYDSTLRDGSQTHGVDFSVLDKQDIAAQLDTLGLDYIEGGWPGANPTDDDFFASPPSLSGARLTAFGMTRRRNTSADNDPGLNDLINSGVGAICIVGKSWDFQVTEILGISEEENNAMIAESVSYLTSKDIEVLFDAEHFFDGYKANPAFALNAIKQAYVNGARWIVLCDTNGGTLPNEIEEIVTKVTETIPGSHLGIHCHNDTGNAVANSLAAVRAGARHIQGTINGLGERCGNANLVSIIPTLILKMGYTTGMDEKKLSHLSKVSHFLSERLNQHPDPYAPYVGSAAFAHKGGLHVSAVVKNAKAYEHIEPEKVGNSRNIVVSDQSGKSNVLARLKDVGFEVESDNPKITTLVEALKQKENEGFSYDIADASFELLARRHLETVPQFFELQSFRVIDERRWNAIGELITISEATTKLKVDGDSIMSVSEGNGPVNALDKALRKALTSKYKCLADMQLVDFKVRIVNSTEGTKALTRVLIESKDTKGNRWTTIGVSTNIIDASFNALNDSLVYKLIKEGL